jgi:glucose-1-phosphate thymidylyltransferase
MNVFVFEDHAVSRLGVLAAARPACDLTIGTTSLHDSLAAFGSVHRVLRPHLARYLAALVSSRVALWGGAADYPTPPPASRHGAVALLVNARVVPSRDNLRSLRSLVEAGHRTVVRNGDSIAAAVLHLSPTGKGPDDALVQRLCDEGPDAVEGLDAAGLPAADARLHLLGQAHEIIGAHEQALEGSLAIRLDSGRYREVRPGLFVAAGAEVADHVAVRHGPVVVEVGAEIGPFVCLDGPLFIGLRARVNPHAWLRAGTVLGTQCRAGGEIEATVMEPFSNKPHDGFLGHSHLGSWVNLAAGTVTSNLKATYGPVRLHERHPDGSRTTVHTGRQFFGALIGDLARTAINTSIPCGARIGVAAAVQGSVAESVPAFTNDLLGGRSTAEQAATVLGRMMDRRGLGLLDADRVLLEVLAGEGITG